MARSSEDSDDSEDAEEQKKKSSQSGKGGGEDERQSSRKQKKRRRQDDDSDSSENSEEAERRRRKRKKHKHKKKKSKKRSRRESSSSESENGNAGEKGQVINERLLQKLAARGETLAEREERRAQQRSARIAEKFGYTAEENPFNDPNLHETFSWKKKHDRGGQRHANQSVIFEEIEKVRKRRQDRELQIEEMERIRAEESRMKELENYDEWARKEEEFHLLQQRQRSAIRLVEGREKPIDVLAKNLLIFGLSDEERENRAAVKYQERYNAMNELETLEAELEKPHDVVKILKLEELEELSLDIDTYRRLESEGGVSGRDCTVLRYWDNLQLVVQDEIKFLKEGGEQSPSADTIKGIRSLLMGQSEAELISLKVEAVDRIRKSAHAAALHLTADAEADTNYWRTLLEQLNVHVAKTELSELHNKMLVRQLERLEERKAKLEAQEASGEQDNVAEEEPGKSMIPDNVDPDFGNIEEELGLDGEIDMTATNYSWQDRFRPRKPRYFHRVKSGYDWNTYNKNHYDQDNPPPKIVQGYRFNVFYPDLIDRTKTPQYKIEPADTPEYCIIRFSAGPPYEDIAFKIINREWNRSRKHGFRSTFERGVLTLYFNFTTHWYRR